MANKELTKWIDSLSPQQRYDEARSKFTSLLTIFMDLVVINRDNFVFMQLETSVFNENDKQKAFHTRTLKRLRAQEIHTLVKIWDTPDTNKYSLPMIAMLLDDQATLECLEVKLRLPTVDLPSGTESLYTDTMIDDFLNDVRQANATVSDTRKSFKGETLAALRLADAINHRNHDLHPLTHTREEKEFEFEAVRYIDLPVMHELTTRLMDAYWKGFNNLGNGNFEKFILDARDRGEFAVR